MAPLHLGIKCQESYEEEPQLAKKIYKMGHRVTRSGRRRKKFFVTSERSILFPQLKLLPSSPASFSYFLWDVPPESVIYTHTVIFEIFADEKISLCLDRDEVLMRIKEQKVLC